MRGGYTRLNAVAWGAPPPSQRSIMQFPLMEERGSKGGTKKMTNHQSLLSNKDVSATNHSNDMISPKSTSQDDIIQFTSHIFYVEEHEEDFHVSLMCLGATKQRRTASYHTEDVSARAGVHYESVSGEISLEPGEHMTFIHIPILSSPSWNPTLEFKVILTDPVDCDLGKYLYYCRVKVIDDDTFPSSKYYEQIIRGEEGIDEVPGMSLFVEYCKLNFFENAKMKWLTLWSVLFDQIPNIYLLFRLYATIYFADVLFSDDPEGKALFKETSPFASHQETAQAIGILYVIPVLLMHLWDFAKIEMDIYGRSRMYIQTNLFRKYLNFSEDSRGKFRSSDMHMAITHDAEEVADGYCATLEVVQILGKLAVVIFFILSENSDALPFVIVLPLLMLIFGSLRANRLQQVSDAVDEKQVEMLTTVSETCTSYRLIADYAQRPLMNKLFNEQMNSLRKLQIPERQVKMNNNYFPKWLGPIFTCIYITTQAGKVRCDEPGCGTISLGTFLATIHIFYEISNDFAELYKVVMRITRRLDPLKTITKYFNLETDLLMCKEVHSRRQQQTTEQVQQQFHPDHDVSVVHDSNSIQIRSLSHTHSHWNKKKPEKIGRQLFVDVNLEVPQGKMVAVVGPHGSGRSTFLKLIGQAIFPPTSGDIYVPTHLRILHVSQTPDLLSLSPWRNLTFGVSHPNDIDPELVRKVLIELKMPNMLEIIDEHLASFGETIKDDVTARSDHTITSSNADEDGDDRKEVMSMDDLTVHGWSEPLTYTEKVKTHIARAFIMNPEVMVLQRPLYHFGKDAAEEMLSHIRQHVSNRGLCLPESSLQKRRPRTVFFSPETKEQARAADVIWQIDMERKAIFETTVDRLQDDFRTSGGPTPSNLSQPAARSQSQPAQPGWGSVNSLPRVNSGLSVRVNSAPRLAQALPPSSLSRTPSSLSRSRSLPPGQWSPPHAGPPPF